MSAARAEREPHTWSWPFRCSGCGAAWPAGGFPYRCQTCSGLYDFARPLPAAVLQSPGEIGRGLACFKRSLPLPPETDLISLGEGGTPLVACDLQGRAIHLKCEHLNPTGSFKDRGSAVLVSALAAMGVEAAVEDSSGNAGASFAAYAARAGIRARVFVPDYASGPKRAQIERYGAEVVRVLGPRSAASQAVRRAAEAGAIYASHAYLPHGLAGMATIAFELVAQLGRAPGAVVMPVGQGTLLLGVYRGFQALRQAGAIERLPRMVGVQARACAPLWAVHTAGAAGLGWVQEGRTIAEGIRIRQPLRGDQVLQAIEASRGTVVAVDEEQIHEGHQALARKGFFVEPTSAVIWPALEALLADDVQPVVAVLTGVGYKAL